ncbi:MAG: hypothetical protein WBZ20_04685 [Nitrososphaeraceae archaeon]
MDIKKIALDEWWRRILPNIWFGNVLIGISLGCMSFYDDFYNDNKARWNICIFFYTRNNLYCNTMVIRSAPDDQQQPP